MKFYLKRISYSSLGVLFSIFKKSIGIVIFLGKIDYKQHGCFYFGTELSSIGGGVGETTCIRFLRVQLQISHFKTKVIFAISIFRHSYGIKY